jgi:GTP-binding protein Era
MSFRSGMVAVVGRPNTGKSTLTNALVGEKVAITSSRPQTTRHAVRGVVHRPGGQVVLIDTPGLHKPRTLLGERLNELVASTLGDVDVVMLCIPADQPVGPGDRHIAQAIAAAPRAKVVAVVTKVDRVPPATVAERLMEVATLGEQVGFTWSEVVPVSALRGAQVELLVDLVIALLPEGPALYPADAVTDEPDAIRVAELIREAALEGVRDELPHSIAVVVEEMVPRKGRPLVDVRALLYVERPSQKAIVIGRGGERLREVGTRARIAIESLLGTSVYLDLHIKIAKEWQSDPKALARLGFDFR